MDYIEVLGKTLDDAITEACQKLSVTSDRLDYDIIEKGSAGFLGIASKNAVIRARVKSEVSIKAEREAEQLTKVIVKKVTDTDKTISTESKTEIIDAKEFLEKVFGAMNLEVEVDIKMNDVKNEIEIELFGKEMGVLIGKRGQTLDSLQYLTSLVINKERENYIRVKVDTENYRKRREETLENLAKNLAYKVKRTKRPVTLEPMNPYERRIIHSVLQNDKYVNTHSEGEEPFRKVIITLSK